MVFHDAHGSPGWKFGTEVNYEGNVTQTLVTPKNAFWLGSVSFSTTANTSKELLIKNNGAAGTLKFRGYTGINDSGETCCHFNPPIKFDTDLYIAPEDNTLFYVLTGWIT